MMSLTGITCAILGHRRSGRRSRVDERGVRTSRCKRCGIALTKGDAGWRPSR